MSAAARLNPLMPSSASVKLGADGYLTVRMAMTDIGTGTYTILAQIAGEMMGLPIERIRVEIGDTAYPKAAGSGGSFGAGSAGSALYVACDNLRQALLTQAGMNPEGATFADGRIVSGCNVENASYGVTLCAECGLVSDLHMSGGGQLVAFVCVDGEGRTLMPCGRCRQLLFEHAIPGMLLETVSGIRTIDEVLPDAFGPRDLEEAAR